MHSNYTKWEVKIYVSHQVLESESDIYIAYRPTGISNNKYIL